MIWRERERFLFYLLWLEHKPSIAEMQSNLHIIPEQKAYNPAMQREAFSLAGSGGNLQFMDDYL